MKPRKVIIVGGGASGIVAAISAAREGAEVTLLEHRDRIGKKILSTGNGRCNLTNEYMDASCFRGDDTATVREVLSIFGYEQTMHFFEELGVILKNRQGYIYPISDQASTILDVLRMEMEKWNISIITDQHVISAKKQKQGFKVITENKAYQGDALILATGSKASPALGADGSGYTLAKQFGHSISPVVPALVQLKGDGDYFKQISGVRTQAKVSLYVNKDLKASDLGELQLTNYGISGIPVFQISRYAAKGLYEKKKVTVEIDFIPSMSYEELRNFVRERMNLHHHKTSEAFFVGMLHKKLIGMLLKESKISLHSPINTITTDQLDKFLFLCKHFLVKITDTTGFEQAQICAGGVKTAEIEATTMESIYVEDLYLAGELLDVDGICGGYNLQWAWATGYIAGQHAAKGRMV